MFRFGRAIARPSIEAHGHHYRARVRARLAGQLPGPPLKPVLVARDQRVNAGLAGQLPGPPLKRAVRSWFP